MNESTAVTKESRESAAAREDAALLPPVDVFEDSTGITLYADLPGVSKEGLNLKLEGDTLTIEGEMDLAMPEGMEPSHAEVSVPRYRRVFTLGKDLDPDKVSAKLERGVLLLRIPKAAHAQPRRIVVQAG